MKKNLWSFGIGLLVLVIIVVIALGLHIGPIVKIGMEEVGPQIAKVSIKVGAVDISLLTSSAKIKGLMVGNPEGYKTPQAISVGTVAVSLDPFSVLSDKIIVHSVHVESPEITFEGGLGSNNLSKIMNNVNALAPKGKETSNKPAPKIEVDDFLITKAKVHVILTSLGGKEMMLPLPNIHLTDMGKGSNGLTPVELTRVVLKAIISGTIKAVTSSVTHLGQGVQNLGNGVGQEVGGNVNKITNSIGRLFGK